MDILKKKIKKIRFLLKNKEILGVFNQNNLIFLNQGLETKELTVIRSILGRLNINMKHVPLKLWSQTEFQGRHLEKSISNRMYGNSLIFYGGNYGIDSLYNKIVQDGLENPYLKVSGKWFPDF